LDIEAVVSEIVRKVLNEAQKDPCEGGADSGADIAHMIEHSVMNPDTTKEMVVKACREAKELHMANVCVSPYYVPLAADCLHGSGVKVCTALGFPQGAASTAAKMTEAREAIKNGAEELDAMMNIPAVKSGDLDGAKKDLEEIMNIARGRAVVKAIYEYCFFTDDEKVTALNIAKASDVDYIKISNAFSGKKASADDVRFVRGIIGNRIGIKIDGGISDAATVRALIAAGAQRFGCSKSVQIITGGQ